MVLSTSRNKLRGEWTTLVSEKFVKLTWSRRVFMHTVPIIQDNIEALKVPP